MAIIVALVLPWVPGGTGLLGSASQAAVFTIVAASLVLLTGWVGQISLGHAALVGIGAYGTGWFAARTDLVFPLSLPVAVLIAGAVSALLGIVALRVRGLYLAVATLIFSWAASEYLFRQQWVLDYSSIDEQSMGTPGALLHLDLNSRLVFYYAAWAIAAGVLLLLTNLRESKTGRAFFAVRGSEMAAASLGIDVLRYKALAFAVSGGLAGIAGNLLMSHNRVVSPDSFDFEASLFFLAIAVVGGIRSLPGAVAASLLFAGLSELFFRVQVLNAYLQLVSTVLLAVIFLAYPGGLARMGVAATGHLQTFVRRLRRTSGRLADRAREVAARERGVGDAVTDTLELNPPPATRVGRIWRVVATRMGTVTARTLRLVLAPALASTDTAPRLELRRSPPDHTNPLPATEVAPPSTNGHRPAAHGATEDGRTAVSAPAARRTAAGPRPETTLVEARNVTVRFGGLTAVDDASLTVRQGEVVGLIGPNGAGKTTLFNSIAGFNTPTSGQVFLRGIDVTHLPVHARARVGLARTFQLIQLFPQLDVFDNLLTATHVHNPTGAMHHMLVSGRALTAERAARERVSQAIELMGLEDVRHKTVTELPFGTLRMVELARALVSGSPVIMLDEPASGLDETETDRLTEILRVIGELGATILLIEHDVRMVMAVSDYLYVLDRGRMIADGRPEEVQRNPAVVTAYLGEAVVEEEVV